MDIPIDPENPHFVVQGVPTDSLLNLLIVDSETTGLKVHDSEAIEVAGVMVKIDLNSNRVQSLELAFSSLQQPTRSSVSARTVELTGITAEMVRGKSFDLDLIYRKFVEADIVGAHNAPFDRPFFEDAFPELKENPNNWVCTCWDPDWKSLGFTKQNLTYILNKMDYEFPPHRALSDCIAVGWALIQRPEVIPTLLTRGLNPSFELQYTKIPYAANKELERIGFSRRNSTWAKLYSSMPDMFKDRQAVADHFSKFTKNYSQCVVKSVDPRSRFSLDV